MMSSRMKFVVIGNVAIDLFPGGKRAGGSALYSSVTAKMLGWKSAMITNFGDDYLKLNPPLDGIAVSRQSSKATTSFEISYNADGERKLNLLRKGEILALDRLEKKLSDASVVMFGPVAGEYGADFVANAVRFCPGALAVAAPQGWMRRLKEGSEVIPIPWKSTQSILPYVDVLVMSNEDIGSGKDLLKGYAGIIGKQRRGSGVVVCTKGSVGATAYFGNNEIKEIFVPAIKAKAVDPTGAGDVFTAAFAISYKESGNVENSLQFAHSAAAYAVECLGANSLASRRMVEIRAFRQISKN